MANKTPSTTEKDSEEMLKAAAVMPESQGLSHVTEQAGLIFDQQNGALSVAEQELSEAQRERDELEEELEELRRERRKYDDQISNTSPTEEEKNNEQTNP